MPITGQDFNAAANMGGSMNQAAMQIARMKYQRALQEQRQALMLGQMALRQHLAEQQGAHLQAQTATEGARQTELGAHSGLYNVQAQKQQELINAAEGVRTGAVGGNPINEMRGPTKEGGERLAAGNMLGDLYKALILSGRGNALLAPHTTPANAVSTSPLGATTFGPRNTAPGYEYQASPDQPSYLNPKPVAAEKRGNIDANLIKGLVEGNIGTPGTNSSSTDVMLYQAATNALSRASAGGQEPGAAAPAGKTLTAKNPQTGQRIKSDDGGKTWQPIQ